MCCITPFSSFSLIHAFDISGSQLYIHVTFYVLPQGLVLLRFLNQQTL